MIFAKSTPTLYYHQGVEIFKEYDRIYNQQPQKHQSNKFYPYRYLQQIPPSLRRHPPPSRGRGRKFENLRPSMPPKTHEYQIVIVCFHLSTIHPSACHAHPPRRWEWKFLKCKTGFILSDPPKTPQYEFSFSQNLYKSNRSQNHYFL